MLFDDDRLLFFDQRHIESAENVALTLNPPVKAGPCLWIEKEWELGGVRAYCILDWQGEHRLYYKVSLREERLALAIALSRDGVTWDRPDLGVVRFNGSTANNLVDIGGARPNEVCVFADPTGPDEHRFKLVCHNQAEGGMYLMTSPDGLRFKRSEGHLLPFITDNCNSSFYDPRIGKYVIYLRGWDRSRPIPPMEGTRSILRAETDDLFRPIPVDESAADPWHVSPKWTDIADGGLRRINRELPTVMRCDDLDDPSAGLYQAAAVQYLPEAYVAFPSLYHSFPWPPDGPFINDGIIDLQFASSRDGVRWSRDLRSPYVRLDLPDGPCSKMMHMLVGMVPNGHWLNQYCVGGRRSHGEGRTDKDVKVRVSVDIGDAIAYRLEQRLDGFVSADVGSAGGSLLTTPFTIRGDALRLNIDTSASGSARAALLCEDRSPIPGHTLDESDLIQGNDTQLVLSWRGVSNISGLRERRVRLLLRARAAKLFAVYP